MQTHNRLTAKLCLTETSVSCAVELSDSEGQQHNIHTHTTKTQKKAWKLRWTFKNPCNPKLIFSCTCYNTHQPGDTRVCSSTEWGRRDHNYCRWPHLASHTHTHIHNSNLPSANNRAVCGEKRKGGVEWHEEQIRQIMVEGNAVRCWTGFIYSDKHE